MKNILLLIIILPALVLAFDPPPTADNPEPSILSLIGIGGAAVGFYQYHKKKKNIK